jgi:phage baseplate assembly protein W
MATLTTEFKGYSSIGTNFTKPVLTNFDLAKRDLLNQFGTRLGERVMLPAHGSIIWELLFDPIDDNTRELIKQDVIRIISEDPRWEFVEVKTIDGEHSITVDVTLIYKPEEERIELPLVFERGEFE